MKVRKTKPEKGNKYYNTKSSGGYSSCIKGKCKSTKKPAPGLNCLANCVGYANGAFNEEHEFGKQKYNFNCNAENFIERAVKYGLSVYQEPMVGGIMVWRKGATLKSKDGAGHVAICTLVDDIYDPKEVLTAESGYNSSVFWTTKRKKGSGNWGAGKDYHYRGCIAPEGYVKPVKPTTDFRVGDKVKPLRLVNVEGKKLKQYDAYYYITKLNGNRAQLSALRGGKYYVWATLFTYDIEKIN